MKLYLKKRFSGIVAFLFLLTVGVVSIMASETMKYNTALSVTDTTGSAIITNSSALTSSVAYPLRLTHLTSGTPSALIGCGIEFEQQTDAAATPNKEIIAIIEAYASSVSGGAETGTILLKTMSGGTAPATRVSIGPATVSVSNPLTATLGLFAKSTNLYGFGVYNALANSGYLYTYTMAALGTATAANSFVITLSIPTGAKLIGANLRVDTALTSSDGGTTWSAAWSGGATQAIGAGGYLFAKDTVTSAFFNVNAATDIASNTTNITVTADSAKTFIAGGTVRAIAYYQTLTNMGAAP
jgi:hypothetical protein